MIFILFQKLSAADPELSSTLAFLTAMITPALLISASGTLILSTSTRLGRVIDRSRELEARLNELITGENADKIILYERRVSVVFVLLDKVTTRSRILQNALFLYYCSLVLFVLTSLTIGFVGLLDMYSWLPVPVGMIGILLVFAGSSMMMWESRIARSTTNVEMDITWEIATKTAPREIVEKYAYNKYGKGLFNRKKDK
jgi:hypothetical protein